MVSERELFRSGIERRKNRAGRDVARPIKKRGA